MRSLKRLLPGWVELAVFAGIAMIFAGLVSRFEVARHDVWAAAFTIPLFIVAACLGLRRSPAWQPIESKEEPVQG